MGTLTRADFEQTRQFIFTDIERELQLARLDEKQQEQLRTLGIEHVGGGNLLAALGLLCYTEFAGKLRFGKKKKDGSDASGENFRLLFDELGADYKKLRKRLRTKRKLDVYDVFRCGLVHEYHVKHACTVVMFSTAPGIGIRELPDDTFVFVVEDYCRDLRAAFPKVEEALIKRGVLT